VDQSKLREAIELLEALAADPAAFAAVEDGLRIRLGTAAGLLSRPDRYTRKAMNKVLLRERRQARRDAERAVLEQRGIRALRKESVFRTPLPMPAMTLDAPVRDDDGARTASFVFNRDGLCLTGCGSKCLPRYVQQQ
jgi:hypothetical protein